MPFTPFMQEKLLKAWLRIKRFADLIINKGSSFNPSLSVIIQNKGGTFRV